MGWGLLRGFGVLKQQPWGVGNSFGDVLLLKVGFCRKLTLSQRPVTRTLVREDLDQHLGIGSRTEQRKMSYSVVRKDFS